MTTETTEHDFPDGGILWRGWNEETLRLVQQRERPVLLFVADPDPLVWPFLREAFKALSDMIEWHRKGTRYGIGVDATDGLLEAGVAGMQLTWMDAKVGDCVVTPRIGKPVEINALWYNALRIMSAFAGAAWQDAGGGA